MSRFMKSERQKIIDDYLAASGRNMFSAGEFIDWLQERPEHVAYEWFFSQDDATAAREHRIALARRMASGLRIVIKDTKSSAKVSQISVREYPAFVSPVGARKNGGGYQPFNPKDKESMAELRRQGATALVSWLSRYRSAFESAGADLSEIEKIAGVDTRVADSA